ncbi:hypothetical protein TNCV_79321 [Trichonephila clavipes]|nr:hypothetical protein TNCV_79321 [Trichonephila clavipes]
MLPVWLNESYSHVTIPESKIGVVCTTTSVSTNSSMTFAAPALSPDFSPRENVWSMVADRLARHYAPVTTVDELLYRVEAAWASVPFHAIQSPFEQMPSHISAVITPRCCYSW